MSDEEKSLGPIPCQVRGCGAIAHATRMKTGRVCVTCDKCKSQLMSRQHGVSTSSDTLLRAQLTPVAAAAKEALDPAPKTGRGWGVLG